jgi:hypothetical protein
VHKEKPSMSETKLTGDTALSDCILPGNHLKRPAPAVHRSGASTRLPSARNRDVSRPDAGALASSYANALNTMVGVSPASCLGTERGQISRHVVVPGALAFISTGVANVRRPRHQRSGNSVMQWRNRGFALGDDL